MTATAQLKHERLALALLLTAGLFSSWSMYQAVAQEDSRPPAHWGNPDFDELAAFLGAAETAVFLTDDLVSANGRIHSCQFAIIPCRLIVKHDWDSLFPEIDRGQWVVFDAKSPASIDDAEKRVTEWSVKEDRLLTFKRFNPRLALFRSLRRQGGK